MIINLDQFRFENRPQRPRLQVGIVIDLDHLRDLMAQFVAEVSPDDPTAYTIPFETFLQWAQRKKTIDRR